ncbi:hypothetical protein HU200_006891 [Digitaria exilis]|uniref:Uncharacterized protein n=1 Tax=Digitaria exilis TaxID=1010633 RepID=A0A835KRN0_9POAL|nr:hypothetical protein HU200_006891 [Digitaria exilis]
MASSSKRHLEHKTTTTAAGSSSSTGPTLNSSELPTMAVDESFKRPGCVPFKWEVQPGIPKQLEDPPAAGAGGERDNSTAAAPPRQLALPPAARASALASSTSCRRSSVSRSSVSSALLSPPPLDETPPPPAHHRRSMSARFATSLALPFTRRPRRGQAVAKDDAGVDFCVLGLNVVDPSSRPEHITGSRLSTTCRAWLLDWTIQTHHAWEVEKRIVPLTSEPTSSGSARRFVDAGSSDELSHRSGWPSSSAGMKKLASQGMIPSTDLDDSTHRSHPHHCFGGLNLTSHMEMETDPASLRALLVVSHGNHEHAASEGDDMMDTKTGCFFCSLFSPNYVPVATAPAGSLFRSALLSKQPPEL